MMKPLSAVLALSLAALANAQVLSTAFNFQGDLNNGASPATGAYDFKFTLYDAPTGGTQVGPQLCSDNLAVTAGRVTAQLDFGAQFAGQQRFLEVEVRQDTGLGCSNSTGFVTLSPRTNLLAEPNSLFSLSSASAANAFNANQLNGQAPNFYTNAANLSTGTLPAARLSGTYSNSLTLSSASNVLAGNGAGLTGLNAGNITSGAIPDARLSANIPRLNTSNAFGAFTNSFLGNVGIGTASPGMNLTVAGDMELGTGSGDYHRFRIGGGNSDGFLYGSYHAFGDGIHMGYNFYANAAGSPVIIHPDGQTSRISTGYGSIVLATGGTGQAPINRVDVDQNGTMHVLNTSGNFDAASFYPDPAPSSTWPQGTYPPGTPFGSAGAIALYGPAGNARFGVRSRYNPGSSVFPNEAELYMDAADATNVLDMWCSGEGAAYPGVSGNIYVTNLDVTGYKNFLIPNPENPEQDITYCCLEGPEAAMFTRGTAHLASGRAHIDLPTTFSSIASKEGLTVILTPLSADSRGLACTNRSIKGFDVAELMQGEGNYDFDWEIKAVRRGCRDYQVLHPWTELSAHNKTLDESWQHRLADVNNRAAKFAAEDQQLGARP